MIIYKVTNLINGKVYIGKTTKNLKIRIYSHKYYAFEKKSNFNFHRAIRKYGFENFEWTIIDTALSEKELNEKEIYWIAEYKKTHLIYNMTTGGEGTCGRIVSDEIRKKLSIIRKGKTSWNKGLFWSDEIKSNISNGMNNTNKAWIGKKHTEETKLKMSIKASGKNNPMYGIPAPNKGKKHSEKTRIKMSESRKKYFEEKRKLNEIRN